MGDGWGMVGELLRDGLGDGCGMVVGWFGDSWGMIVGWLGGWLLGGWFWELLRKIYNYYNDYMKPL